MTQPIAVTVSKGAAYIRYRDDDVARTLDLIPTASVAADLDNAGRVVGIEILDIASAAQVDTARRYASERALAFPREINGVTTSTSA